MLTDADCQMFIFIKHHLSACVVSRVELVFWCMVSRAVEWNVLNTHFANCTSYGDDVMYNCRRRRCGEGCCLVSQLLYNTFFSCEEGGVSQGNIVDTVHSAVDYPNTFGINLVVCTN